MPASQLVIINGKPGSGKTTLATLLSQKLYTPLLSRDQFKEGYVNSLDRGLAESENINLTVYHAYFEVLHLALEKGFSLVIEAAFQHNLWAPQLERLRKLADIRIVYLEVDSNTTMQRRIARDKTDPKFVYYHNDKVAKAARDGLSVPKPGDHQPPRTDLPILRVNATDGYDPDIDEMLVFIRGIPNKS